MSFEIRRDKVVYVVKWKRDIELYIYVVLGVVNKLMLNWETDNQILATQAPCTLSLIHI